MSYLRCQYDSIWYLIILYGVRIIIEITAAVVVSWIAGLGVVGGIYVVVDIHHIS